MNHLEMQHWKLQFRSTRKPAKGTSRLCSVKDHYTSAEAALVRLNLWPVLFLVFILMI